MFDFSAIGKTIAVLGLFLLILGLIILAAGKIPFLGKLPGDIFLQKGNFTFYFPLATSVLLSIILTIILNLLFRH
ncbi:DUF2905 domain-containing protein [Zhaonella formicivorans]|jgi:hypothetical protein|uniref:DUF2905 domain-containing protein n=1 Tax=Zhaonella formicivorans TaxID=2528593 RepID=UPI0010D3CD4E|nr:DUF2905 domain-containing protein [Zhaonella formicivorans]